MRCSAKSSLDPFPPKLGMPYIHPKVDVPKGQGTQICIFRLGSVVTGIAFDYFWLLVSQFEVFFMFIFSVEVGIL